MLINKQVNGPICAISYPENEDEILCDYDCCILEIRGWYKFIFGMNIQVPFLSAQMFLNTIVTRS